MVVADARLVVVVGAVVVLAVLPATVVVAAVVLDLPAAAPALVTPGLDAAAVGLAEVIGTAGLVRGAAAAPLAEGLAAPAAAWEAEFGLEAEVADDEATRVAGVGFVAAAAAPGADRLVGAGLAAPDAAAVVPLAAGFLASAGAGRGLEPGPTLPVFDAAAAAADFLATCDRCLAGSGFVFSAGGFSPLIFAAGCSSLTPFWTGSSPSWCSGDLALTGVEGITSTLGIASTAESVRPTERQRNHHPSEQTQHTHD